jgi:hypothetical protein
MTFTLFWSCAIKTVRLLSAFFLLSLVGCQSVGCQSSVRMTRPGADASLNRPVDWIREQDEEADGILFQIRHPIQPARVRLRRLETAISRQAHDPWARLWLAKSFDDVTVEAAKPSKVGGNQATTLVSRATGHAQGGHAQGGHAQGGHAQDGDEAAISHELVLTNAGAQTYLLEAWGSPDAMKRTSTARRRVIESLELSPAAGTPTPSPAKRVELSQGGVRLALPAFQGARVDMKWQSERVSEHRIVFELPSHLIEGEVLIENLDYPIDALTYAETATGVDVGDDTADANGVTIRGAARDAAPISMHTTRRFLTSGERGVQIAVSTPDALYETNSEVIDSLVETLEFVDAAE